MPFYVPLVFGLTVLSVVDVLLPQTISKTLTDVVVIGFGVVVVVKAFGKRSTDGCDTINNRNINFSNVEDCKILMSFKCDLDAKIVHYLDYLDAHHDTKLHLSHIILLFPVYSSYLSTSNLWMLISTGKLHYDWAHLSHNENAIFLKNALVLSRC